MVDHTGTVAVKASAVSRDFSKAGLEKRLGAFVPHDASRMPPQSLTQSAEKSRSIYQKIPMPGTNQLYQQYLLEKEAVSNERKIQ